jgi:type III pantothenate kinase
MRRGGRVAQKTLLAADIGNSNIVIGAFRDNVLISHWRINTEIGRASDEYGVVLKGLISSAGIDRTDIEGSIVCSVVPGLNRTFVEAVRRYISRKTYLVGEDIDVGIKVLTDNPGEVGADRIVNAVAAKNLYKLPVIVADFGTAITFDYVTARGYMGGVIAPGIAISAEALFNRTAKLPRIDVARPGRVVGRNTVESMRSGMFFGFAGLTDRIIEKMRKETGGNPGVIATGGMGELLLGESRYIKKTDEFLTLKGLKFIYEKGTR